MPRPLRSAEGLGSVAAFTLIELLVVIAIIGVLATIGIPALKGFGSSNAVSAATRQLMDDMSLARQTALNNRSDVHMVFVPALPKAKAFMDLLSNSVDKVQFSRLTNAQYSSYALYASRTIGDQPGRSSGRYLTPWRTLPEGVFIATNEFAELPAVAWAAIKDITNRPFHYVTLPFPSKTGASAALPAISYNYQGQLSTKGDEYVMLTRGSLVYSTIKGAGGSPDLPLPPEVVETPKNNTRSNNVIRIDWLTGRARTERLP